jgi:hypothetical protein
MTLDDSMALDGSIVDSSWFVLPGQPMNDESFIDGLSIIRSSFINHR